MENEKRTFNSRTKKRSRSGATHECKICKKKLRGEKGLKTHMKNEHGEAA